MKVNSNKTNSNNEQEEKVNTKNVLNFILNENNKWIDEKFIKKILFRFGIKYKIKNLNLFKQAMTHKSYINRNFIEDKTIKLMNSRANMISEIKNKKKAIELQTKTYERLEFYGDAIIHAILAKYLYERYEDKDEGFLTKLRTKLENKDILASLSRKLGFGKYIIIGKYIEDIYGRNENINIMEDVFESFIGALMEDCNSFEICEKFVVSIYENELDIPELIRTETNFKDKLLQYYHEKGWNDPVYELKKQTKTEYGKKYFTIIVKGFNGDCIAESTNTSIKKSQQEAAKHALEYLNVITNYDDDKDEFELEI